MIIAIGGGKGGTGKTFLSINIADILSRNYNVLLVDCDVENPSVEASLNVKIERVEHIFGFRPIFTEKCKLCEKCVRSCPENALIRLKDKIVWIESLCSGCRVCKLVCPFNAIEEGKRIEFRIKYGSYRNFDVIIGEIEPGNRRSNTVISVFLKKIKQIFGKYDFTIIDCPAGTGSGLYNILKLSDFIVAVTEPTPLGLNDLEKFMKLVNNVGKIRDTFVVINKYGIKTKLYGKIFEYLKTLNIDYAKVSYSKKVAEIFARKKTLTEIGEEKLKKEIEKICEFISTKSREYFELRAGRDSNPRPTA